MGNEVAIKVIIAGGRDFNNYDYLKKCCDEIIKHLWPCKIEVVCGGAAGADELGKRYAIENEIPVTIFEAQWKVLGKKAGPYRNRAMALYSQVCICFWNGESKGTKNMIDNANEQKLKLHVFNY